MKMVFKRQIAGCRFLYAGFYQTNHKNDFFLSLSSFILSTTFSRFRIIFNLLSEIAK